MSTADENPTQPLPQDRTDQQEDPVTTPFDTGPSATRTDGPEQSPSDATPAATAPAAATTAGTPAAPTTTQAPKARRGMRVGTMVWGLVLATLGVGVVAWAVGLEFDQELAFIVLVAAAGTLLLVGSLATTLRRRG